MKGQSNCVYIPASILCPFIYLHPFIHPFILHPSSIHLSLNHSSSSKPASIYPSFILHSSIFILSPPSIYLPSIHSSSILHPQSSSSILHCPSSPSIHPSILTHYPPSSILHLSTLNPLFSIHLFPILHPLFIYPPACLHPSSYTC